jgi:hypothetical protein
MHLLYRSLGVALGNVVILVEIDLAQQEHVLATHEEDAARDVGVETGRGRAWGKYYGRAGEDALGGALENEVGCVRGLVRGAG